MSYILYSLWSNTLISIYWIAFRNAVSKFEISYVIRIFWLPGQGTWHYTNFFSQILVLINKSSKMVVYLSFNDLRWKERRNVSFNRNPSNSLLWNTVIRGKYSKVLHLRKSWATRAVAGFVHTWWRACLKYRFKT